jgi:hypothetical protein
MSKKKKMLLTSLSTCGVFFGLGEFGLSVYGSCLLARSFAYSLHFSPRFAHSTSDQWPTRTTTLNRRTQNTSTCTQLCEILCTDCQNMLVLIYRCIALLKLLYRWQPQLWKLWTFSRIHIDSEEFWPWCISLGLWFYASPEFWKLENTIRKLDTFPPSGEGEKTFAPLGPLGRAMSSDWGQLFLTVSSPLHPRTQLCFLISAMPKPIIQAGLRRCLKISGDYSSSGQTYWNFHLFYLSCTPM